MADGTLLELLNRPSRRQLEKDVAPWYAIPDKFGALEQRQLRLGAMDDRIFDVASGGSGADGWDREAIEDGADTSRTLRSAPDGIGSIERPTCCAWRRWPASVKA